MELIGVNSLREDISFTGDLYIDDSFLLLPKTVSVSTTLINELEEWGFKSLYCDGSVTIGNEIQAVTNTAFETKEKPKKDKLGKNVKKAIENSRTLSSGTSHYEAIKDVYTEYSNYIEALFTHYATHKEIDQDDLFDCVKDLCVFVKDNKRFLLKLISTNEFSDKNFLISHSLKTTILAICIALQLHTPLSKMVELAVTCILHEIGMLQIPPQLYMTDKKFSSGEKAKISKHTIYGYTIVQNLQFPISIQHGVLDHHEKENGTGYPRHLTGDKISNYAKIIAIACSYEAISSPRKYKDEHTTFDAIVEILQNKNKQYDDAVVKALLYTVSLYPIGTYVYLSNRKVGIVYDTNPESPKCPVVQLLTEKEADGSLKTIQTDLNGIHILRILSKKEKEDILKIFEERQQNIKAAQELTETETSEESTAPKEKNTSPESETVAVSSSEVSTTNSSSGAMEEIDINMFN